MHTPTEFELEQLLGHALNYDPVKAHEYYLRTRKLKGRKPGSSDQLVGDRAPTIKKTSSKKPSGKDPRTGKSRQEIELNARAKARKELKERIDRLSEKLHVLESVIRKKEHEEDSENRKSKAKSERAAKERDKPKSAAEKAEAARDSKKYRDKNQQKLESKSEKSESGGGGSGATVAKATRPQQISDLKALHTKVKGQIAVAKQKLSSL